MDRVKVGTAAPFLAPPVAAPASELLKNRLSAYWQALGVTDPDQVAVLSEQALQLSHDLPPSPELEPVTQAIVAAGALLDDWLAQALHLPRQSRELVAARAALLSGAAPNWPTALFAPPGEAGAVLDALRAAIAEPTPPPSPSPMPVQRIDLFWLLGPLRRLWRREASA